MSSNDEKKWDRTKWFLLIAVLMIIEGFIFYAAMENSQSTNALGFISFAGTITSIILAVLAIIYGFVQNGSQERKSDGVAEQMGRIREVVDSLQKSKSLLGVDLIKLENIANRIDEVAESSRSTSRGVQNLHETLEKMQLESNNIQIPIGEDEDIRVKLIGTRYSRALVYLILKAADNNLKDIATIQSIFEKYIAGFLEVKEDEFGEGVVLGASISVWIVITNALQAFDVVAINEESNEITMEDNGMLAKIKLDDADNIDKLILEHLKG